MGGSGPRGGWVWSGGGGSGPGGRVWSQGGGSGPRGVGLLWGVCSRGVYPSMN